MAYLHANGIRLSYQRSGQGDNVLLIMGSGAAGHVWTLHQTPALHRAGYQTVAFNNRGVPPSDAPEGMYALEDLVADTKELIEALDLAPCRIVGTSMGAIVAQELAIGWPHLVRCAVLMATRARPDAIRRAQVLAQRALLESGVRIPRSHDAVTTALQMLSPATLNDDAAASSWLEILELAGDTTTGQVWIDTFTDRRELLRGVTVPCRVIAFADDLIAPPYLCAEVAEAIPDCDYMEIPDSGHLGYLERPHEVNTAIIEFLDKN
ncbi:alpha/beta fold hydrolase [Streptomyces sp. NPDC050528]|uniref:alpha/beta fold hydrolase n=1 Tax=Streptomyces sp. NPDC050528 TaxID=3365623 RepID=UPI0037970B83